MSALVFAFCSAGDKKNFACPHPCRFGAEPARRRASEARVLSQRVRNASRGCHRSADKMGISFICSADETITCSLPALLSSPTPTVCEGRKGLRHRRSRRAPFLKQSRCFRSCAVGLEPVHERFADALFEVAIHSSLGGQHGEEGNEGQDEVSGEEAGGEEDRQKENREEEVKDS